MFHVNLSTGLLYLNKCRVPLEISRIFGEYNLLKEIWRKWEETWKKQEGNHVSGSSPDWRSDAPRNGRDKPTLHPLTLLSWSRAHPESHNTKKAVKAQNPRASEEVHDFSKSQSPHGGDSLSSETSPRRGRDRNLFPQVPESIII